MSYTMYDYFEINQHLSAATPLAIGVVKELTDKNFDAKDLISWGLSGVLGAYVIPGIFATVNDDEVMVGYSGGF